MQKGKTEQSTQKERAWSLLEILAQKDIRTAEHSIDVACMAEAFTNYIYAGLEKEICFIAGLLHDIGKIMFKDYFFQNVKITAEEDWKIIRSHPEHSKKALGSFQMDPEIIKAAYEHHERTNGSGYPQGLKGEKISILGRILAIVDSYSAITEDRPYRPQKTMKEAVETLVKAKDEYDKDLLKRFILNLNDITKKSKEKAEKYKKELHKSLEESNVKEAAPERNKSEKASRQGKAAKVFKHA